MLSFEDIQELFPADWQLRSKGYFLRLGKFPKGDYIIFNTKNNCWEIYNNFVFKGSSLEKVKKIYKKHFTLSNFS